VKLKSLPGGAAAVFLIACLAALSVAPAAGKSDKKDKNKPPAAQVVDSGSFGVFVRGQRVATETFKIEQENGASRIKSQFQAVGGANVPTQKSELDMTQTGELLRYEWSQASGASLSVAPNNDFLVEKMDSSGSGKPAEQSFLLPSTAAILDNNFFVHREVLAWRYLSAACHPEGGNLKCQQGPAQFGALVPQAHISISVRLQLIGKEKITVRGVERELLRLNLTGEDFEWAMWVDDRDQFKLIRVAISADNTEVVRD
jgi:hypothetical protein